MTETIKQLARLVETDATVRRLMTETTTDYRDSLERAVVELATEVSILKQQLADLSAQLYIERNL